MKLILFLSCLIALGVAYPANDPLMKDGKFDPAGAIDCWQKVLEKQMDQTDAAGQVLLERLLGTSEILEHHLREGNFNNIISMIHRVSGIASKLGPHLQNTRSREINEKILADIDKLVSAKISGKATPQHLEELIRSAYNDFKTLL